MKMEPSVMSESVWVCVIKPELHYKNINQCTVIDKNSPGKTFLSTVGNILIPINVSVSDRY